MIEDIALNLFLISRLSSTTITNFNLYVSAVHYNYRNVTIVIIATAHIFAINSLKVKERKMYEQIKIRPKREKSEKE